MRPIISADQCPISLWANVSFKIEYTKRVVGDQTIFACQSGPGPQDKINSTCTSSDNRTINTADPICSNDSEGTMKSKV